MARAGVLRYSALYSPPPFAMDMSSYLCFGSASILVKVFLWYA